MVEFTNSIIPMEVKYIHNIRQKDLLGLLDLCRNLKLKEDIVVKK